MLIDLFEAALSALSFNSSLSLNRVSSSTNSGLNMFECFLCWEAYVAGISRPMPLFLRLPVTATNSRSVIHE